MAVRFVCIFGMPRTGSNLLFSLLRNCRELNLKYEIFHPKGLFSIKPKDRAALLAKTGSQNLSDQELIKWRHASSSVHSGSITGSRRRPPTHL